ncbi:MULTISPECIES: CrcB family protein [Providencia]|uniref:CrcB family protein n=1 Tax=Providencia TaxID=586 RepID=UPI00197E1270|nr:MULTISPECIES: CrcB family protein [Providencia]MBN4864110.1 CrcB family protein [Providencia stuartii]MBN4873432.1 CrcB family protein [Providencia stuartii]MBN4877447.1 CrcB family protein [Providencia stuartii]MBN4882633.1 CrcB family protein [Providencia stuartii]
MNIMILVFIGGAIGAISRELLMVSVPTMNDHFPLDIFIANIIASLLLGIVAGLLMRKKIGQGMNAFFATGVMGGLSTFSSFVYGAVEIMKYPGAFLVAVSYLILSVVIGFAAIYIGYSVSNKQYS